MLALCPFVADMLDDMIGQHHVKGFISERQLCVLHLVVAITLGDQTVVVDVDCVDFATQLRVRTEVVGNSARARTNFKHAYRLRAICQIQQTFDLQPLKTARWQIEHGMWLTRNRCVACSNAMNAR